MLQHSFAVCAWHFESITVCLRVCQDVYKAKSGNSACPYTVTISKDGFCQLHSTSFQLLQKQHSCINAKADII